MFINQQRVFNPFTGPGGRLRSIRPLPIRFQTFSLPQVTLRRIFEKFAFCDGARRHPKKLKSLVSTPKCQALITWTH